MERFLSPKAITLYAVLVFFVTMPLLTLLFVMLYFAYKAGTYQRPQASATSPASMYAGTTSNYSLYQSTRISGSNYRLL